MKVTCKMRYPGDPMSGIWTATREDGRVFVVARYPGRWEVDGYPQTFRTKREAVQFVANLA